MDITHRLARHIETHFARRAQEAPIAATATPQEIRAQLESAYDFARPLPLEEVFEDTTEMLWKWTEHATSGRHFGLCRPTVDLASVIADALVSLYDPNLATWDFSPVANEIERHVLGVIARRFGYDPGRGLHHFTSGGEEANHTAVLVALTHRYPTFGPSGLRHLGGQPVFYLSEEGHHSFEKIAHAVGLGRRALRFVRAGSDLKMDPEALAEHIREDRSAGLLPFMVIATAGTTNAGVIDSLPELAATAAREQLWFHVDAAWGGAAALSDKLRPILAGIEKADSITCDAHKLISVPVGAGMFFCRHRDAVATAFATETSYVPDQTDDGRIYPFVTTMQWSRRFMGLKVFMMFAVRGLGEIVRRIERQAELGDSLRDLLIHRGWRVLNATPLPVVCFTHPRIEAGEISPAVVVQQLRARQAAWISKTELRNETPALRASITNYETEPRDLDRLIEGLEAAMQRPRSDA